MISKIRERFLSREVIAYLICGVLTTLVGYGTYSGCDWLGFNVITANTVSTILAVIFAFFVNKAFVFQSKDWALKPLIREILSFSGGRFVTYIAETVLLVLMVDIGGLPSLYCKLFTMVLTVLGNYFISKFFVFKKRQSKL